MKLLWRNKGLSLSVCSYFYCCFSVKLVFNLLWLADTVVPIHFISISQVVSHCMLQIKPWSELSCLVKLYFCFTVASLLALLGLTLSSICKQRMNTDVSDEDNFTVSLMQLFGICEYRRSTSRKEAIYCQCLQEVHFTPTSRTHGKSRSFPDVIMWLKTGEEMDATAFLPVALCTLSDEMLPCTQCYLLFISPTWLYCLIFYQQKITVCWIFPKMSYFEAFYFS